MAERTEPLRVPGLICSLTPSPAESSSALMVEHVVDNLRAQGAQCEALRCVDYNIAPGVEADMGDSDQWPQIRQKILDADMLVLSTPTWVGHASSVAQRVLERLDLDEVPEATASTHATVARNAEYPPYE